MVLICCGVILKKCVYLLRDDFILFDEYENIKCVIYSNVDVVLFFI